MILDGPPTISNDNSLNKFDFTRQSLGLHYFILITKAKYIDEAFIPDLLNFARGPPKPSGIF